MNDAVELGYKLNEALSRYLDNRDNDECLVQMLWDNKAGIISHLLDGRPAQGAPTLTNEILDASLSEFWDASPRAYSESNRVAMRKAIETALSSTERGREIREDGSLCSDCPPLGDEYDGTRCLPCPRRRLAPALGKTS